MTKIDADTYKEKLNEAEAFYKDRIQGWMLADLRKSIAAATNFLTALGCLVYTEVIGTFLPPIDTEQGSQKEKRFYRCLYRLPSAELLKDLDTMIRAGTKSNKGIYQFLRHSMAHKYYPMVSIRKDQNTTLFVPTVIARDGFMMKQGPGRKKRSAPVFLNNHDTIAIATNNYTLELEKAVDQFMQNTFDKKLPEYQTAAIQGIDAIHRGIDLV